MRGSPGNLHGFIDPHVHAAPEHVPRLLDDFELARQARDAGMAGVLIKSHSSLTAGRATIASRAVPGICVWGGLVLNWAVGGLNPAAVETALHDGAAEIWMPTLDAANQPGRQPGRGISILDETGAVRPEVHAILGLIAEADVILGTGHLSTTEIMTLVPVAREHGVHKILVTHPEAPFIAMPHDLQRALAQDGCRFERTWVFTTPALGCLLDPASLIADIRAVGTESTVLATDMGQVGNPPPVEGFAAYVRLCRESGFSETQVEDMAGGTIKEWLP